MNAGALGWCAGDWRLDDGTALGALANLMLVNLAVAVPIRQQHVLNVLFGLAERASPSWPLWLRWTISHVNQIGGIHVGAALAGTAWLLAFAGAAAASPAPGATLALVTASVVAPWLGDALVDEVVASQPAAVIWDTTVRGKPDLLRLAIDACGDFRAEAAFVVSNQLTTFRVVRGLGRAGIPAFGPIWDS